MPFVGVNECEKCNEQFSIDDFKEEQIGFDDIDCPKCGAKKSIYFEWETEWEYCEDDDE